MVKYPYYRTTTGDYFPVIDITAYYQSRFTKVLALVDSGATVSIFKEEIAQTLGIKIKQGKEIYMGGVGGRIKGYLHNLIIETAGKKIKCPVVFSHEYSISFNLIGRENFFAQFKIIFEEKNKRLFLS